MKNILYDLLLPCCICKNSDPNGYKLLYRLDRGEVIRCNHCGLIYVNDLPEQKNAGDEYFDYWGITVYQEAGSLFRKEFRKTLKEINKLKSRPGKLLDIGCGPGYFLTEAKQFGWNTVGMDISQTIAALARKRGECVYGCTLNDFWQKHSYEQFDCITLLNLLEHLTFPAKALSIVRKLLKKDGLIVIETPTEDSLIRKTAHSLYRLSGGKIDHLVKNLYHSGGHHFGFSEKTIKRLLVKRGFKVINIQPILSSPQIALKKRLVELAKAQKPEEKFFQICLAVSIFLAWMGSTILGPRLMANRMLVLAAPCLPPEQSNKI